MFWTSLVFLKGMLALVVNDFFGTREELPLITVNY